MHFSADARRITIVREMFLETADENYVSARSAFFDGRDRDFWWLTLHAVEKYLKALLLLNGASAKGLQHDLITILHRVKGLDGRLTPPPFKRPLLAGPEGTFEPILGEFIQDLNTFGHPSSRYATYSYVISGVDIFRADQLVYWARRHARTLAHRLGDGASIDWVAELAQSPGVWRHHSGAPLERLADLPTADPRRHDLARSNATFFPNADHEPVNRGWFAKNAPIYLCIESLKRGEAGSAERKDARAILQWLIECVQLSKPDRSEIQAYLDAHP